MNSTRKEEVFWIVKEVLAANPTAALSGSIALAIFGYKLRREPVDIDFYIPESASAIIPGLSEVKLLPNMKLIDEDDPGFVSAYDDENTSASPFIRLDYHYKDYKINFFLPGMQRVTSFKDLDFIIPGNMQTVKSVSPMEIIKFKFGYSVGAFTLSANKHRLDLIHFLSCN